MLVTLLPLLLAASPTPGDHFAYDLADLGDVDGDGVHDFAVADSYEDHGELTQAGWIGLVSGRERVLIWEVRGTAQREHLGRRLQVAGDVDGDGRIDLGHAPLGGKRVEILSARSRRAVLSVPGRWVAPAGDVNGDARGDLVAQASGTRGDGRHLIGVVRSGADGEVLRELTSDRPLRDARPLEVGDVDGDGRADWGLRGGYRLLLFRAPDGAPLTPEGPWRYAHLGASTWLATADDGSLTLHTPSRPRLVRRPSDIARPWITLDVLGDVDDDGTAELFLGMDGTGLFSGVTACARRGADGKALWSVREHDELIHDMTTEVTGDLDGDGVHDVLIGYRWAVGGPPIQGWVQARSGADGSLLFELQRADLEP